MEVGFFMIMLGLAVIVATVACNLSSGRRKCGNCKYFNKTPGSKHIGDCPLKKKIGLSMVMDYEEGCNLWTNQEEE